MSDDLEPWAIASEREHGLVDWLAIAARGLGALLFAIAGGGTPS